MDQTQLTLMKTPGYVNAELAEILKDLVPVTGLDASTDILSLRQQLAEKKKAAAQTTPISQNLRVVDKRIQTRDGGQIAIRIYSNEGSTAKGPVMVMLHGGGWVLGGLENEEPLCRRWVDACGGISVNVDYRLAPEHVFPTAVYDCYDAVLWVRQNAHMHEGDLTKGFIVAGISAGANMAATISHLYRDEQHAPPITGVYLSIPSLLAPEAVPTQYKDDYNSREENKNALVVNENAIKLFRSNYQDDPRSPLMSPVIWPTGHAQLPRTYFQIAGGDPFRDEALLYEKILREDYDVETRVSLYPGLPHGFWSWWLMADFSKKHAQDCIEGLLWLLGANSH